MSKTRHLIIFLFSLNVFSQEWGMLVEEDVVTVSIDGNISAGDKHRFMFFPFSEDECQLAHSYFSNYSMADNAIAQMDNLPSKYVLAMANEKEEFLTTAVTASDFLLGTIVYFYASRNPIEDLVSFYSGDDVITIELLDFYDLDNQEPLNLDINNYFDLPKNTWNLKGFEDAMKQGQEECLQIR
tara:strand:- start:145 stop:696 length:552 start_codon:yes stop_codon:yes gene_type:complete